MAEDGSAAGERGTDEIWKMVDDAERYLVSGMFEQATSLAFSISRYIHNPSSSETVEWTELDELPDTIGMILVQSLKELGRTQELFAQLRLLYGSLASIPVEVFITSASLQIMAKCVTELTEAFPEYLSKWRYIEGGEYTLEEAELSLNQFVKPQSISAENYLKLAELYSVSFVGVVLKDFDFAVSWVEEAPLAEEVKKKLLHRLRSLKAATNSSTSTNPEVLTRETSQPASPVGTVHEAAPQSIVANYKANPNNLKSKSPLWLWWFHSVRLRIGSRQIVVPSGKLMFFISLSVYALYVLQRSRASLKRIAANQASSLKSAVLDALQLAFSVQMNPLAAVQQVPSAPRQNW